MNIIYIKELEEFNSFNKKTVMNIKKFFNNIEIKNIENKTIYYLPITKNIKLSMNRIKKISKKISMLLEEEGSSIVALSEYLNSNELLKKYLYSQNINILDGRYLFKCLTCKIIEYILNIRNEEIEFEEATLLVNDFTNINRDMIIHIAKSIKRLNIVTNHINKCKKIEKYLYNEFGIMLSISNNKRRSLLKSKIIINIDFPEESINQYRIYEDSIIVNVSEKININSKRFNGININYYKLKIPEEYKMDGFQYEIAYESLIYNINIYGKIIDKINDDKIEIESFIGNNGIILSNLLTK